MIPSIAEAAALIAARKLSPVELTEACLARAERLDGRLHAFIRLLPEEAWAAAREAEARIMRAGPRGPLDGIPAAHKDIYGTAGIPTTGHSRVLQDHLPAAIPFNLTGWPGITVPTGFGEGGLPVAMQLDGKPFAEPPLFRAADAYEKAHPWRATRPALAA